MYFSKFPNIVYDFNIKGKIEHRIITDITRNVRFRKKILENISLYDEYDIKDGETPEIISEKIYGSPFYHWVIMLVNQRYDYINDFPITQREMDTYTEIKYGSGKHHAHHYLYKDPITSITSIKECPITITIQESDAIGNAIGSLSVGSTISVAGFPYIARIDEIIEPSNGTTMKVKASLRTGQFLTGTNTIQFSNTTANVVSVSLPEGYSSVSNYDYEDTLNETKRRIKIIDKIYIDQILKEFEDLV
jgi:hypothetical protein